MTGSVPKSVFAQGYAHNTELRKFGDHDQVVVSVRYANGSIAVIDNGRWSPFGYDQRLEVGNISFTLYTFRLFQFAGN